MTPAFTYNAKVEHVVDGDTIDFLVDLGFTVRVLIRTRLLGIDTPEVRTAEGRHVRDVLRAMLPNDTDVVIKTSKAAGDKYGRWLAQVWLRGACINDWLVEEGHARPYDGGKKDTPA